MLPLIHTIILNTNRRDDTLACVASLAASDYPAERHQITVLDNASTDGSVMALREQFPQVRIVELTENLGYAGNNNVGIELAVSAMADWIFVLNEDTTVDSNCLSEMMAVAQTDPTIGVLGPMVYHYDEPTIIQSAGGYLDRFWESYHIAENEPDEGQFTELHTVDWISGCAIMMRREVVEQVGALDGRFFYYWEETEWCIRAARAGWQIIHVPQAKLWHKGVQRNYQPKPSVTYYRTRNQLLTLARHRAPLLAWTVTLAQIGRTLTSWTVKPRWRHMRPHRDAMWQGVVDFARRRYGMRPS